MTIYIILAALVGGGLGFYAGRVLLLKLFKEQENQSTERAKLIIREAETTAETQKREKMLEAKEHFLKLKAEYEEEANRKKNIIIQNEAKVKQREQHINKQQEDHKKKEQETDVLQNKLTQQLEGFQHRKDELETQYREKQSKIEHDHREKQNKLEKDHHEILSRLERIANLSADEAREQLVENLKSEASTRASSYIKDIVAEAKLTATKEAKKVVIETIQRTAAEHAIENCVSIFNIESDDIKGKIIGREGRNIRALEAATGVEIIVDDTPEAIIISGFDPVRREIARLSLHRLVADGRIHPARIEEVVAKTKKSIDDEIVEIGERTAIDLGIHGLHPELIRMVGRMRFRSSYGQNLLQHSREVANLCATMAAELGLNVKHAKRAGLLHDIGKVTTEEPELPHAIIGMHLAQQYKEHPDVCNAIGAHHDEVEMMAMISPIIQSCDAISGSRPGARREIMESYIKRLKELEETALSFDGVNQCYAIQAGRELRVVVDADNVTDERAAQLSFDISQKIEKEMQYPGQIKVTVIREMRSVSYAK